jgi:ABC-2 type transport system permease protein
MRLHNLLTVAQWEFIEKVRTKAFVVSLVLTPLFAAAMAVLPALLASRADQTTKRFAVYDETASLVQPAQQRLTEKYVLANGNPAFELLAVDTQAMNVPTFLQQYAPKVFGEEFTGLVVIRSDVAQTRTIEYRSENVSNIREIERLSTTFEKLLAEQLALKSGINANLFQELNKPLKTKTVKISKSGDAKEAGFIQTFGLAYGSVIVLFILVVVTGQILVRGLVEEKSNRIIEILISSCSPFELMMGKLLGLSGLGIVQATVWAIAGLGIMLYSGTPLSLLANVPLVVVFTLLGYVLYASLLLGIGSLTTTEQEAQQVTGYVTLFLVLPLAMIISVLQSPNSTLAKAMSLFPLTAPTAMVMRISVLMPAWWEIALSIGLMLASIVVVTYFSAKIFRVAILVYGKRPTLPEVIAFLREP